MGHTYWAHIQLCWTVVISVTGGLFQ